MREDGKRQERAVGRRVQHDSRVGLPTLARDGGAPREPALVDGQAAMISAKGGVNTEWACACELSSGMFSGTRASQRGEAVSGKLQGRAYSNSFLPHYRRSRLTPESGDCTVPIDHIKRRSFISNDIAVLISTFHYEKLSRSSGIPKRRPRMEDKLGRKARGPQGSKFSISMNFYPGGF